MTTALKNIVAKLDSLSTKEQDAIASLLTEELAFLKSYKKSNKKLSSFAAEAQVEYMKKKKNNSEKVLLVKEIKESVNYMKLVKTGKAKARPANEVLNEL